MRILLVTSSLDDGGAEKWMLDTVSNLDRTNLKIDYYFWSGIKADTFYSLYQELGVNLDFRYLDKKRTPVWLSLFLDLKRYIQEHGPYDAIHVNGTPIVFQAVVLCAVGEKIRVRIVHSHNSLSSNLNGGKAICRSIIRKYIVQKATSVVACSELAGCAKYGNDVINNPKFCILKNGININQFQYNEDLRKKTRNELGLGECFTVLHIGRITEQKNHGFLLDVFSEIVKQEPEAKLLLIGKGEKEKEIFQKASNLNLEEKIIHIPWTTEVEKYLSSADIFVFPSLYEGFGIVLLEAQSNGLRCVVSDVVPKETNISQEILFIPLKDQPAFWAKQILLQREKPRYSCQEELYKNGYDICQSAQEFLEICKGDKRR